GLAGDAVGQALAHGGGVRRNEFRESGARTRARQVRRDLGLVPTTRAARSIAVGGEFSPESDGGGGASLSSPVAIVAGPAPINDLLISASGSPLQAQAEVARAGAPRRFAPSSCSFAPFIISSSTEILAPTHPPVTKPLVRPRNHERPPYSASKHERTRPLAARWSSVRNGGLARTPRADGFAAPRTLPDWPEAVHFGHDPTGERAEVASLVDRERMKARPEMSRFGKRREAFESRDVLEDEENGEFRVPEERASSGHGAHVGEKLRARLPERLLGGDRLPQHRDGALPGSEKRQAVRHDPRGGESGLAAEVGVVTQIAKLEEPRALGKEERDRDLADEEPVRELPRARVRPVDPGAFYALAAVLEELEPQGGQGPDRIPVESLALKVRAHEAVIEVRAEPPLRPPAGRKREPLDLAGGEHSGAPKITESLVVARGADSRARQGARSYPFRGALHGGGLHGSLMARPQRSQGNQSADSSRHISHAPTQPKYSELQASHDQRPMTSFACPRGQTSVSHLARASRRRPETKREQLETATAAPIT